MVPLFRPETAFVTATNGVPYWCVHGLEGHEGRRVEAVDPQGRVSAALPFERALGCVVYPACEVPERGVVEHLSGDRFTWGGADGAKSERARGLSEARIAAGFKAPVRPRIRDEIWVQLWV